MTKGIFCVFIVIAMMFMFGGCKDQASVEDEEELFFLNKEISMNFESKNQGVVNPFMGFAPEATSKKNAEQASLVYVDVTFAELMPNDEYHYDFETIEKENNLAQWKSDGKHVVFRFVCDKPSSEPHMDIPNWLYDKIGGDGTKYDINYGKGFSPNYNNKTFIAYHMQAVSELGKHFGADGFFSYVELGSLGHWGEWHVNYEAGIGRLPREGVRELYIRPYINAFPNAKILMRRPFNAAAKYGFGIFNDMAGEPESTEQWLEWIENGGDFNQAEEKNAMTPMEDSWKTAPIGGELTSSLAMDYMLKTDPVKTNELIARSHTTFLGPKCPITSASQLSEDSLYQKGKENMLLSMGYRLSLKKMEISKTNSDGICKIDLMWNNFGVAPLYFKLPVHIYILDKDNNVLSTTAIDIDLTKLIPGQTIKTSTKVDFGNISEKSKICIGIVDPMTGKPAVILDNDFNVINDMNQIYQYK